MRKEPEIPPLDPWALVFSESEPTPPRDLEVMHSESFSSQMSGKNGKYSVTVDDRGDVQGFSFINSGKNIIVPKKAEIGLGPERQFTFEFPGRRFQDVELRVTDTPSAKLSDLRENWMMFFPRKVIPALQVQPDGKYKLTLPTGEEVVLKDTFEIESGVLSEGPMDLSEYAQRKELFPYIVYNGTGIWLRVKRRGENPHSGQIAWISRPGEHGEGSKACKIHASQLWQQNEGSGNHFLYAKDEAFDAFLKSACGFGFL